jgi:hypothetical protein
MNLSLHASVKSLGWCRLCLAEDVLRFSHILPEFFYAQTYDDKHRLVSVIDDPRNGPRTLEKGLREHLLCAACEKRISELESYAATVLRRLDSAVANKPAIAVLRDVRCDRIHLFALSLLWRMHVSSHHMFREVSLGPHADALRLIILGKLNCQPRRYGTALAWLDGLGQHSHTIVSPRRRRFSDRWAYHFMARGYEWVVLVSTASAELSGFPYVQGDSLVVPKLTLDAQAFVNGLRHAFPQWLGRNQRQRPR